MFNVGLDQSLPMSQSDLISITFNLNRPDSDDQIVATETAELQDFLETLSIVESVEPISATGELPAGAKAAGSFLLGLSGAEVSRESVLALFKFLQDRLGNQPVEAVMKTPDSRELTVKVKSREEFDYVFEKWQAFEAGRDG